MWPTTDGMRIFDGVEADLIRGVTGMMIDQLVAEGRQETQQQLYQIESFDCWDWQQRLWLLEQVVVPLLTELPVVEITALHEATIEAIFAEVTVLIELELDSPDAPLPNATWRESVYVVAQGRLTMLEIPDQETDLGGWTRLLDRLRESLFGPLNYVMVEPFRDGSYQRTQWVLQQRGLPEDFFERIPPLQTIHQTQAVIDRLQAIVFQS